ncbi:MAG: photosystem II protein PsbQ [Cyanobacteria bacterium J06581_3]
MRRYKAVVGVLIAAIASFLVSCSSGPAAAPPTYTPEKISQLTNYVSRLETSRNRLPELLDYIEKDNWVNVDNFTHGPLGQLRAEMLRLSGQLLPRDQPKAKALSEEILGHLQNLDEASQARNYGEALTQYREFVGDFEALLSIVPEGARNQAIKKAEDTSDVYEMTTTMPEPEPMRAAAEDMVRTPVLLDEEAEE